MSSRRRPKNDGRSNTNSLSQMNVFGRSIRNSIRSNNNAASASASASAPPATRAPAARAHVPNDARTSMESAAVSSSSSDPSTCVICMEDLKGRLGVANPCGHVFHQECFGTWDMQRYGNVDSDDSDGDAKTKCPTCRRTVDIFTHIHESVGNLQFGEIDHHMDAAVALSSHEAHSLPHAISPASTEELSSFVQSSLAHVRGGCGNGDHASSFGGYVDMEQDNHNDALCARISDLKGQIASLESILQSAEEHQKQNLSAAQHEQEHLARGMLEISNQNETLEQSLRDSQGAVETLTQENDRLRNDLEEGRTIMNDMLSAANGSSTHNATSDSNNSYHSSSPYDYQDSVHKHPFT